MPQYMTPGVYVEEVSRGPRSIEMVGTGTAAFLGVTPDDLTEWVSARSGPPRAVFEKAVDVILAEHDRRALVEKEKGAVPRRRRSDH